MPTKGWKRIYEMNLNNPALNNEQLPDKVDAGTVANLESISSGIVLIRDGYICSCNPKFAALLGYRVDEIVNQIAVKDIVFNEDWNKLEHQLILLTSSEINSSKEILRIIRNDKSLINVQVFLSKTTDEIKPAVFGKLVVCPEKKLSNPELNILAQAIRNINDGILLADFGSTIYFINDAFQKILGYSSEELIGKNVSVLFKDSGEQSELYENLIDSTNYSWQCEIVCRKKDGIQMLSEVKKSVIKDNNNTAVGALFSFRGISEKDRAMGELKENEHKYHNLFEKMHYALVYLKVITDDQKKPIDLIVVEANKAFELLTQIPNEEQIGQSIFHSIKALRDFEPNPLFMIGEVALGGKENRFEIKAKNIDQWFSISAYSPEKNYAFVIIHDITKQQVVEENLRKLSQAVEQSPASIIITDTDGNIEYVNSKFCSVTGYSFQEVIGKNPKILKSGEMSTEAYKKLWQEISSGRQWTGEFHNIKKNGELYWESASISPIIDKNGLIKNFLAVKEDITERKKSEKAFQESERVLRETQTIAGLGSYVLDITKGNWQSSKILDEIFGIDDKFVRSIEGWISLIHPDWRDKMADYFSNVVLKQHVRFNQEYKIIRKCDGEERWVHGLGELEFDSQHQPIKMLGTISDITERKLTNEALNHSLSLLEGTLESTIDGILVVDQNGKIQKFNKKFIELWRIPEFIIKTRNDDAALNYVLSQLKYPENFINKVKELYKDTMAESIDLLEFKDGRVFERFSRPQLVGNKAVGRVWSFRDITDKKIAEEALIESEKKFRTVVEEAAEIVFTVDTQGYFTYVNTAGLKASGYSLDELKQLKYIDLIESDYKQRVKSNYLKQYLERSELSTTEYPIKTKSGEIKWFNQNARLIIENDDVIGFYAIARDTTERRVVEEALRESEEKFRALFETSTEGILVADADENNILVNPRIAEMTGYSVDELMKMNFQQLIPPHELKNHSEKHENRRQGNSEIYERKLLRKDGSVIWTLVSAAPILNKEGKYNGSFGMFTDITEQKKMMGELISAKDSAEEMNKLKSIFLANMSHELRTPLIGIIGYAETLYNELEVPDFKEMAHTLLKSGTRLKETLNLILNLSHIEAGKIDMILSPQNFTRLVRDKLKQFHLVAKDKGIKLSIYLSEEDIIINADEMMLSQVIENLLANAIKYTLKGEIIIAVTKMIKNQEQYVEIKIQDTGIGIPKERVNLIFEPFRQASEGLSRTFEGIGLGLTVSKKFIELMGGEIFVESDVNKGSTFIVRFPLVEQNSSSETFSESSDINSPSNLKENNCKYSSEVLLIEDDKPTANIIKFYLSEICKTDWAPNGEKAIEMVTENNYSIILVDINLGMGLNGIETINKIKEIGRYKSVPIVAVTAYALYGDKEKFLNLGCDYYMSKPFDKSELIELVDSLLAPKH